MRALANRPPVVIVRAPKGTQYIQHGGDGHLLCYKRKPSAKTDLLLVHTTQGTWTLSMTTLKDLQEDGNYLDLTKD